MVALLEHRKNFRVSHTEMQINSLHCNDAVLMVICAGTFGVGSEGNPSGRLLKEAIERWMLAHPGDRVEQAVIDFAHVDYTWGDGPVWSLLPFIKSGLTKVRLKASVQNWKPLDELIHVTNLPWFVVEGPIGPERLCGDVRESQGARPPGEAGDRGFSGESGRLGGPPERPTDSGHGYRDRSTHVAGRLGQVRGA